MTGIVVRDFAGIAPMIGIRALAPNMAQTATDCKLWSHELRAWNVPLTVATPSKVGTKLSIYRYGQDYANDTNYWFHWLTDVNVARGPIAGDTAERTYFTGAGGVPQVTDSSIAMTGGTTYPMNSYNLGLPVPVTPTATLGAGGAGTPVSKAYVVTYVSAYGEEGPTSLPSNIVAAMPGQTINLSTLAIAPTGAYQVTSINLYRSNTGTNGTAYQFVASIAIGTTTYADSTADSALGGVNLSATYVAPPANMIGLIALPNGIHAGFFGNTLCLSAPFLPHAYPVAYQQAINYEIVGLGVYGTTIVICTKGFPFFAPCTTPQSCSVTQGQLEQACVSKRSIVSAGTWVMYAGPSGLVKNDASGTALCTDKHFSIDEWTALVPSSISGYYWNGKYVGFYNTGTVTGGFIFDPDAPAEHALTKISTFATAGYNDPIFGHLYLQVGANIQRWDGTAATPQSYTWRSRQECFSKKTNLGIAKIDASAYPISLALYVDGVLNSTTSITSATPQKLPSGFKSKVWEAQITGTGSVQQLAVVETMEQLRELRDT